MTNCKVLSFKEIHETNQFMKSCESCVNKNYRKNLELVEENARAQQAKMDVLYWKKRAEEEGTQELVDMYERFNSELAKRTKSNNANNIPPLNSTNNLNTPFNNSFNLPPPPQMNGNTPRGAPLSLSDLTGPARVSSASTARVNAVLDSAESLIRRVDRPAGPFGLSPEQLANSRAGLRPANTRPASAAPPSNSSARAQQSSALMEELRASIASRASRGSRRSSVSQLSSPSSSAISNASSVLANVAEQQLPTRGRPPRIDLTASEIQSIAPTGVDNAPAGSGLKTQRSMAQPGKKKRRNAQPGKQKKNVLM